MIQYRTTLGEVIEYPTPPPEVAAFLRRVEEAAEDPQVSESELITLIYGIENPLLEQGRFVGRGAVTKATLANPVYHVLLDLLQHKSIALGRVTSEALLSTFSMTVADAAEKLGMTPDGVLRAVRAQRIAGHKTTGGYYLLDPRSVESYRIARDTRGFSKGLRRAPALRIAFGNSPGKSFGVKFADLKVGESQKLKDGKLRSAEVKTFRRGAVKITGAKMHRTFILEPAAKTSRYDLGPFFIEGRFKIVEKVNDPKEAARVFREFEPS